MINQKRIPFIPKLSREFKPMKHYLCETDTSAKLLSRSVFMRLLAQQPCPKPTLPWHSTISNCRPRCPTKRSP